MGDSTEDVFVFNAEDMFDDDDSPVVRFLTGYKGPLIGGECIVDDRTAKAGKCSICRVILKEPNSVITHMKSIQHVRRYCERYHPKELAEIDRSSSKGKGKYDKMLRDLEQDLLKKNGRKKPRVHEKGYGAKVKLLQASNEFEGSEAELIYLKNQQPVVPKQESMDNFCIDDTLDCIPTVPEVMKVMATIQMTPINLSNDIALVQPEIDRHQVPVIGLGYVAEYPDPAGEVEPGYICLCCQQRFTRLQVIRHVISADHRMAYLRTKYTTQYTMVSLRSLTEERRTELLDRYTKEISEKEGPTKIQLRLCVPTGPTRQLVFGRGIHKPLPKPQVEEEDMQVDSPPRARRFDRQRERERPETPPGYGRPQAPVQQRQPQKPVEAKRPNFIYSEREQWERLLPTFCERNLQSGWYSIRSQSLQSIESSIPPYVDCFSIRGTLPSSTSESFYDQWTPALMRRVQDKFNFKLEHMKWLQKLLIDHNVSTVRPLARSDVATLDSEVEVAVLDELLGKVLVIPPDKRRPDFGLREYNQLAKVVPLKRSSFDLTHYNRNIMTPSPPPTITPVAQREPSPQPQPIAQAPKPEVELLTVQDDEKDKQIRELINHVLSSSTTNPRLGQHPLMRLLLSFEDPPELMYQLATKAPDTLGLIVSLIKNPNLIVSTEVLTEIAARLRDYQPQTAAYREVNDQNGDVKNEQDNIPAPVPLMSVDTHGPIRAQAYSTALDRKDRSRSRERDRSREHDRSKESRDRTRDSRDSARDHDRSKESRDSLRDSRERPRDTRDRDRLRDPHDRRRDSHDQSHDPREGTRRRSREREDRYRNRDGPRRSDSRERNRRRTRSRSRDKDKGKGSVKVEVNPTPTETAPQDADKEPARMSRFDKVAPDNDPMTALQQARANAPQLQNPGQPVSTELLDPEEEKKRKLTELYSRVQSMRSKMAAEAGTPLVPQQQYPGAGPGLLPIPPGMGPPGGMGPGMPMMGYGAGYPRAHGHYGMPHPIATPGPPGVGPTMGGMPMGMHPQMMGPRLSWDMGWRPPMQ